jgi:putative phosphoesterase
MKLLIASDCHDNFAMLAKAVVIANERGCEHFLFAGDFISPPGLKEFESYKGHVHFVFGNCDGEKVNFTRIVDANPKMTLHDGIMYETFGGLKFYMNHYPDFVRNAARTGDYGVCVYGHTHEYHEETLENGTHLLNPGELMGYRTGISTCMVFDTHERIAEKITLS